LAAGQAALTALIAAVAERFGPEGSMQSALAGGVIGIVAGLYQALRMFGSSPASDPARYLRAVYVGEAMKILITAALFVAAIRLLKPQFLPFIGGYSATFLVYWVALGTGYPWFGGKSTPQPRGPV
jgi:F0F1-type ATP synthase assembly protein I